MGDLSLTRPASVDAAVSLIHKANDYLVQARDVPSVKKVLDMAEMLRVYLRQQDAANEAQKSAGVLSLRAAIRLGEITREMPTRPGSRSDQPSADPALGSKRDTLKAAGIPNERASEYERMAANAPAVEEYIARSEEVSKAGALQVAKGCASAADGYDGDEWYTPPEVISLARNVLGSIDLDPASNAHAQKTVKAARFHTKEDDSLTRDWHGRVFCNPPYSMPLIAEFTAKLLEEYDGGRVSAAIYLVNNCTDSAWFHSLLSRFPVCFTRGRIAFLNRTGKKFATRQGQAIFYLGTDVAVFRQVFSALGTTVSS